LDQVGVKYADIIWLFRLDKNTTPSMPSLKGITFRKI